MPHRHTVTQLPDDTFASAEGELTSREAEDIVAAAADLLRERAEIVLNSVADGIFCLDHEGRTIFVNEAGARMFGFSAREMIGRSQHQLVHHHYADGAEFPEEECPIYSSVREGITQRVGGDVFWRKDGTQVPVDYTSIPLKEARRVVGAVVTFRDVSVEQRAEQQQELLDSERAAREEAERARAALEASEERLRLAMSAGRMASWEWDIAGNSVHWSPEEEALYGLEPGTFEGTTEGYAARIHPEDRDAAFTTLQDAMARQAGTHSVTHRVVWPDGEIRWLESHGQFVYDGDGKPVRLVGVSMDVTERRSRQEQAGEMQQLLESAFESSPSAIAVTEGADHVLRWANARAREFMGERAQVGKPLRDVMPELGEQGFIELLDRVFRTGESFTADSVEMAWHSDASGELRHGRFNVVYQPVRDANGAITGVMSHSVACA